MEVTVRSKYCTELALLRKLESEYMELRFGVKIDAFSVSPEPSRYCYYCGRAHRLCNGALQVLEDHRPV